MNNIKSQYDVLIIGGGINGVGIAADCAGRGLSVVLCEKNDLASGTSSASSKLIHGGLRYLEQYDFKLVKESLHERTILQSISPHLTQALPFIIPCHNKTRPAWLMRLGLFLYDLLAFPSPFAKSSTISFSKNENNPLKDFLKKGFVYTDCQTDDARLVILNALRAKEKGAKILTRTRCIAAFRCQDHWQVKLAGQEGEISIQAKVIVNASGPWLPMILKETFKQKPSLAMKLVKGSHFVVPKLYKENQAYLLQHRDKRVVFVIPYHENFSLIGTTDEDYQEDLENIQIAPHEIQYLCDIVNQYFKKTISEKDILYSWSGVRPLLANNQKSNAALNRGYHIELQQPSTNLAPLINIYGGKLTTYRLLAEKVTNIVASLFKNTAPTWTSQIPLPGNNHANLSLQNQFPWLPSTLAKRYQWQYGSLALSFLENAKSIEDLGQDFSQGLYEKEVRYLMAEEWAQTAEDILFRRTKLGLVFTHQKKEILEKWLNQL